MPEPEIRASLLRYYGPWMTDDEIERVAGYVWRREARKRAPLRAELARLDATFEDARHCGYAFLSKYRPRLLREVRESGWAVLLALIAWERWRVNRIGRVADPAASYGPMLKVSAYSLQRVLNELHAERLIPRTFSRRTVGRALHRLDKLGLIMYRPGLTLKDTMEMLREAEIKGRSLVLTSPRYRATLQVSLDTLDGAALLYARRDPDMRVGACLRVMERLRVPGLVRRRRVLLSDFYRRMRTPAKQADTSQARRLQYEKTHREDRRLRDAKRSPQRAALRREYFRLYKAQQRRRHQEAVEPMVSSFQAGKEGATYAQG